MPTVKVPAAAAKPSQPTYDVSTIGLAVWRVTFFLLMAWHWNYRVQHRVPQSGGLRYSFAYDHLEWVTDLLPDTEEAVERNRRVGVGLALLAAAGVATPLTALGWAALQARAVCSSITNFTNHDYLFALLSVLAAFSGAGRAFSFDVLLGNLALGKAPQGASSPSGHRWVIILLRAQLAVVYLFASLWKTHPDWIEGLCVRSIFLSFERQRVHRGVPWAWFEETFGQLIWQIMAFGGLALDSAMFASLAFLRPRPATMRLVAFAHILFHGFTSFAMGQRIGYTFPLSCICAQALFIPFSDGDASTLEWTWRLFIGSPAARANRRQRLTFFLWIGIQLGLPARMPIVSNGEYALTAEGYRWSWTMMLHSTQQILEYGPLKADLAYFVPDCPGRGPIPRQVYMPNTVVPGEDPRTLPVSAMFGGRHSAALRFFPRQLPKIVGAVAATLDELCRDSKGLGAVKLHGAVFVQLNGKGAYTRLVDPTVDLAAANRALQRRTPMQIFEGAIRDKPLERHEHLLRSVGKSLSRREALELIEQVKHESAFDYANLLLDRSACLATMPIMIRTMRFSPVYVRVLRAPRVGHLVLRYCDLPPEDPKVKCETEALKNGTNVTVGTKNATAIYHLEVQFLFPARTRAGGSCASADEDLLIAIAMGRKGTRK